jgi:hypothetical protein
MNVHEQLVAVRAALLERDASGKTLRVVDKMIKAAEPQRDSSLSVSQLQVLRHMMKTPDVLNDEDIRLDFISLEGDLEDAATQRSETVAAYDDVDRRPKLKKFYKKK